MAFRDLREWIAALDKSGELQRIAAPVEIKHELATITDLVSKSGGDSPEHGPPTTCLSGVGAPGGKALLFEHAVDGAKNHDMPVLINQFGSKKRMAMALGVEDIEEIPREIASLLDKEPPQGFIEGVKMLPELSRILKMKPVTVRNGKCQEVVKTGAEARLSEIPVITAWPEDAGPFISLGCVFTRDPETGKRNVGMYRLQVYDETSTGMHWHKHHSGAEHADKTKKGEKMPVAVAIGTDPTVTFAAVCPLPPGIDEMLFAGYLRHGHVEMTPCKTVPLEVPATAEIVLEGWVDPSDLRREGPYGDHTGFYSLPDDYPVFRLSAITHRKNPIYATTIVGPPPMEDCWMAYAIERIFLPLLKKVIPEIVDYHLPFAGVFHNMALISIRKRYPGHARKVMHAVWGLGQLIFTKTVVIFDADVDVHNLHDSAFIAMANIDPERDFEFSFGPSETLDHASRLLHYGSKVGIDATKKLANEGFTRPWPQRQTMDPAMVEKVKARWKELGL